MADVVLVDDYNRPALGTVAPNGQPYQQPGGGWTITGGVLRPTAGLELFFNTGRVDVEATLELATAIEPFAVSLVIRREANGDRVLLTAGSNGVLSLVGKNGSLGNWPGEASGLGAGDTIGLEAVGNTYDVKVNGTIVHTVTDPDETNPSGSGVGIYEYLPGFTDTTGIASLTVAYDLAANTRVHVGQAHPASVAQAAHTQVAAAEVPSGAHYLDPFDAASITDAPNGEPYGGSGNWSIVANQAKPTSVGDSQLVVDTGVAEWDRVHVTIAGNNGSNDVGLLLRWVDGDSFLAVSVRPDVQRILVYYRDGGFVVLQEWFSVPGTADPTGRVLEVSNTGNDFTVTFDGNTLGTVTTAYHAGATRVGLWSYNTMSVPFDDFGWSVASPPPLVIEGAATHLRTHAGAGDVEVPAGPSEATAAHIALHGGAAVIEGIGTDITVDVGAALRGPIVYGPLISRPGQLIPRIEATIYDRGDLVHPLAVLDQSFDRHWQEILSEAGTGGLRIGNEDPDLDHVGLDTFVRFEDDGFAAFCMLVRDIETQWIAQGEEVDQVTTISGPGHIAILEEAVVWPSRGVGVRPIQQNRAFNWTATDYDDQWWGYADQLALQGSGDAGYWTGLPPTWPDPAAWWIWAHVPNSLEWAPAGSCYLRHEFVVPDTTASLEYYVVFDGYGDLYIDGEAIASGEYGIEPDINVYSGTVEVTPGPHTIAVRCENDIDPEADEVHNPGGLLFTAFAVTAAQQRIGVGPIVHSDETWRIVEYPPGPPGMTPGEVVRHVIEEAQVRGGIPLVDLAFTDETDSDGNPWPETTDIATKVGYDLWTFFKELCATYIDLWMEPASFRLWAWNKGSRANTRNPNFRAPTDTSDPMSGNLVNLTYRTLQ